MQCMGTATDGRVEWEAVSERVKGDGFIPFVHGELRCWGSFGNWTMALTALVLKGERNSEWDSEMWAVEGGVRFQMAIQHCHMNLVLFWFALFLGHRMDSHWLLQQCHHLWPNRKREYLDIKGILSSINSPHTYGLTVFYTFLCGPGTTVLWRLYVILSTHSWLLGVCVDSFYRGLVTLSQAFDTVRW